MGGLDSCDIAEDFTPLLPRARMLPVFCHEAEMLPCLSGMRSSVTLEYFQYAGLKKVHKVMAGQSSCGAPLASLACAKHLPRERLVT